MDAFKGFCEKFRNDPETGKNRYCILQAEDELAAIGMVIGAVWDGARAFTSTAGPGISLMSELIGLAYYAEIPAVIVDVQRTGPSTGMPTRTQQGDILLCAYASHGDTKHILLFPANPQRSASTFAVKALRPGRALPDAGVHAVRPRHRHERLGDAAAHVGRRLPARPRPGADGRGARAGRRFYRYSPDDERRRRGAHAARRAPQGRVLHARLGPQQARRLHRDPRRVPGGDRPPRRASTRAAAKAVPAPVDPTQRRARRSGVVTVGGCDPAVREALDLLARRTASRVDYMRVRGFPFGDDVRGVPRARTSASSSSSRTATRSCAALLMLETGVPQGEAASRCCSTAASR